MATRFCPGRSSSGRKLRPIANRIPSNGKKLADAPAPVKRTGSFREPNVNPEFGFTAAMSLNDRLALRQSTKFAGATVMVFPSRICSQSMTTRSGSE
jgi:hypothetical protein